jgi:adenosine deaminase
MRVAAERNLLLASLGRSPMIVPEAFLAYGIPFDEVHVFTTENAFLTENLRMLSEFFSDEYPGVKFSFTVTAGIERPDSPTTHACFEEALFQWYAGHALHNRVYACISGGIKTIPSMMQKAAHYFGAENIFHALFDGPEAENPRDLFGVKKAITEGKVNILSIGREPGWSLLSESFDRRQFAPVRQDRGSEHLQRMEVPVRFPLTAGITHIMNSIRSNATGEESTHLPFSMLRILPPDILSWLEKPLERYADEPWILQLPKIELHCHLGGFATHGEILDKVRAAALRPAEIPAKLQLDLPEGWPLPQASIPLDKYTRMGDNNGTPILRDPGCLSEQIRLLYDHFLEQHIRYAEVRCSPQNYALEGRSAWDVLCAIKSEFQTLMDKARQTNEHEGCHVNLIIIATRKQSGDLSMISRHLSLAITASDTADEKYDHQCRIVGVDLAGFESRETRATYFRQDFIGVHRCGLAVTAHAGENDDAEGIWQAVFDLNVRRLGHALELGGAKDLLRSVADRGIGVEMCPFANYQIKGFAPMKGVDRIYPLKNYLEAGVSVCVNTDNIGISDSSLSENLLFLSELCPGLTRMDVLTLLYNGVRNAFIQSAHRDRLMRTMDREIFKACLAFNFNP